MSILIKGMEMPTSCSVCWALDDYGDYPRCRITEEQRGYTFPIREKRMDNCPLVPVPPHGRLIDADALKTKWDDEVARLIEKGIEYLDYHVYTLFFDFKKDVDKMPTIISEEEGE